MKKAALLLVVVAVCCMNAGILMAGDYSFPSPMCYGTVVLNGFQQFEFAYYHKWEWLGLTITPRIGIWEPDFYNNCSWAIPYSVTELSVPALDVPAAWSFWLNSLSNSSLGISFTTDITEYWGGYEYNDIYIQSWVDWGYKDNEAIFGHCTPQIEGEFPFYRVRYSTVEVLNDKYHLPTDGKTPQQVLVHELGHALFFGDERLIGSYADGMYGPNHTTTLGQVELSSFQCGYNSLFLDACQNNVSSKVSGFWVDESLQATWMVNSEEGVGFYTLEGLDDGVWVSVADTIPSGVGQYAVAISGPALPRYRLKETANTHLGILCYASPGTREEPVRNNESEDVDALLDAAKAEYFSCSNSVEEQGLLYGEKLTVIGPLQFLLTVSEHALPLWAGVWGCDVQFFSLDYVDPNPAARRAFIEQVIADGENEGVSRFLLVGAANDYMQFQSSWWDSYWWNDIRNEYISAGFPAGGYPEYDFVPTWYYEDSEQPDLTMSRITPYYYSDFEYSDIGGDGLPDVSIIRWPAVSQAEIKALLKKIYEYSMQPVLTPGVQGREVFLVGDESYRPFGDDYSAARETADVVKGIVPGEVLNWTMYMSEISDLSRRNLDVSALLNSTHPNLVLAYSNGSNPYSIAGFLDADTWDMNLLDDGVCSGYVGASCLTADFARTYSVNNGRATFLDFLFSPSRGAHFWVGPVNATWQDGNSAMIEGITSELFEEGHWSISDKFRAAQEAVLLSNQGDNYVSNVARSYAFFGDPLSPFRGGGDSPVGVPVRSSEAGYGVKIYPNPFNPGTSIELELREESDIAVRLFDISGKLVRILLNERVGGGKFTVFWDGRDSRNYDCSAGVYFVQIIGIQGSETKKILLLK
jgi:hypothetical protein